MTYDVVYTLADGNRTAEEFTRKTHAIAHAKKMLNQGAHTVFLDTLDADGDLIAYTSFNQDEQTRKES